MTPDLEAIDRLIEAVEAGNWDGSWKWLIENIWDINHCQMFSDSYRGSLDAALPLKEALVPFWAIERMSFWPGGECYFILLGTHGGDAGVRWHKPSDGRVEATDPIPSRALLLATLRAHRHQITAKGAE